MQMFVTIPDLQAAQAVMKLGSPQPWMITPDAKLASDIVYMP
jgi:hypothetical protein